ncbi:MAG: tyrosine-protein phosphatase [Thermodesulfobacteriota bacterium]
MLQPLDLDGIEVVRLEAGEIKISWEQTHLPPPERIYASCRPELLRQALGAEGDGASALPDQAEGVFSVAGPDAMADGVVTLRHLDTQARYYFKLAWADGSCRIVAERRVPMEGAANFRDLGGYRSAAGRRLQWGKVFRSDGLYRLKEKDLELFEQIGICQVFDFRTPSEAAAAPNRLPHTRPVGYLNLPVSRGEFDFMAAMKRIAKGDTDWLTPDFMVSGYIHNLEAHAKKWGRVLRHVAGAGNAPTLFHCTGGKDRTGICAALILLALNVPEETVIRDHQLSNVYIAALIPRIKERIAAYGIDPDLLDPYLTAPEEAITAAIDHLRLHYGSACAYLREKAGVYPGELDQLRENLLERQCL